MTIFGIATLGLMGITALLGLIVLVWKITGAKKLHKFMLYCFCAFMLNKKVEIIRIKSRPRKIVHINDDYEDD